VCFLNLYSQDISNKSVGEILDETGVIKPNSSGSYNAEGYEMTYGNNKEPIFKKIDPSSVQTSTYGWGSVGSGHYGTNNRINALQRMGPGISMSAGISLSLAQPKSSVLFTTFEM